MKLLSTVVSVMPFDGYRMKSHVKHLQCKKGVAKYSRIIPGRESMNRLVTTRSDIKMWLRLSILTTLMLY